MRHLAILSMVMTGVLWSFTGLLVKVLPWNGVVIAGLRGLVTTITLWVYLRCIRQRVVINKRTLLLAVFLMTDNFAFLRASQLTKAANAVVLQYTAPIFILAYGVLVKKRKLQTVDCLAVGLTLAGIVLVFVDQMGGGSLRGDVLGALSGLLMAGMHIANGNVQPNEHLSGLLLGQAMTALIGIPFIAVYKTNFTAVSIGMILFMGAFQLTLSYLLFDFASKRCSPLSCSLLSSIEPILNPIWVFLFVGETPSILALFGGLIVIITITAWCMYKDAHGSDNAASM